MNFTVSEENYLKAVFQLQVCDGVVSTNALAQKLQTRPASVTDMMKKLNSKQLVHYTPYHGFHLTDTGKKEAVWVVRRHRLWEVFLEKKLGFTWDEVHGIAEELEHVRSKKLIDKLDAFLEFPNFDPHGDPIPNSRGKIKTDATVSLAAAAANRMGVVSRVANQSAEMLELLAHKGIGIGTRLEVIKKFDFDKSFELRLKTNTLVTVSNQLAKNIFMVYEN